MQVRVANETEMLALGARLAAHLKPGGVVLLRGNLGAGKTTLVRGVLQALGVQIAIKSPTYNLFSIYETTPPVLHADLYRIQSTLGTGIEDYLDTHACLIEWPDALADTLVLESQSTITIDFDPNGDPDARTLTLSNISL